MFTGEVIKEMRLTMGLTLAGFAKRLGVTESAVSLWESNDRHPRFDTLVKLNDLKNELAAKLNRRKPREKVSA